MILPEEDLIQEQIEWLAQDIIDIDADVSGLTQWTQDFVEHYNNSLENIDSNFNVLDERTKSLKDEIQRTDSAWLYLFWFLVIWNFILSGILVYHVFF